MTAKQTALYFREWQKVHKRYPDIDRHDLHTRALGQDKSSKAFTNADLDKVLAEFKALTQPANLEAQLRQEKQERVRLIWGITNYQFALLSLYVKCPGDYLITLIYDRIPRLREDTNRDWNSTLYNLTAKELQDLRNTLAARINDLRNARGHTIHEMHVLATLKCHCADCTRTRIWQGIVPVRKDPVEEPF